MFGGKDEYFEFEKEDEGQYWIEYDINNCEEENYKEDFYDKSENEESDCFEIFYDQENPINDINDQDLPYSTHKSKASYAIQEVKQQEEQKSFESDPKPKR